MPEKEQQSVNVYFPGDQVQAPEEDEEMTDGCYQQTNVCVSSKMGILQTENKITSMVAPTQKLYIPHLNDLVIGTIAEHVGEGFRVDIGASQLARLDGLAFDGASKRNRPNLAVGSMVYARVVLANKFTEPHISCTSLINKKDWVTRETLFGELIEGYSFSSSIGLVHSLYQPQCNILSLLGAAFAFEIATGMNGRIWIKASSPVDTVLIANALINSQGLSNKAQTKMVSTLVKTTRAFAD